MSGESKKTSEQTYTGNNHVLGGGVHVSVGNPSFILRDGDTEWLTEWHYYFGPMVLNKKDGSVRKQQPGSRSRFWLIAKWWKDQGAEVLDGFGVWVEPRILERRYRRAGRNLLPDPSGDVVRKYYEGYECDPIFSGACRRTSGA